MLKSKLDKKNPDLDLSYEQILVCNNKRVRPFIEIVVQDPENIDQQSLGTLLGIFEISDESDDSSYVVNYLISIIKKEYYSKPKRGPVESFESALRKANLALSKLAEHGNINWIGKLNALCAVMEKNKLHLAQVGTASAFLLRSKLLTEVSEGLSEQSTEPNPLKTFDNLSSGKLEIGDKLIITTGGIFDIFSLEEIKKSALRFSSADFVQYLRTALGNLLDMAAVLIVDVKEKVLLPVEASYRGKLKHSNAFSQTAFIKQQKDSKKEKGAATLDQGLEKSEVDYRNKQTGHIYIKESDHQAPRENVFSQIFLASRTFLGWLGEMLGFIGKKISKVLIIIWLKIKNNKFSFPKEKINNSFFSFWKYTIDLFKKIWFSAEQREKNDKRILPQEMNLVKSQSQSNWFPDFSKISGILKSSSYEQKLYSILALIAIFVLPYIGIRLSNRISQRVETPVQEEIVPIIMPLADDKNITRLATLETAYTGEETLNLINLNDKLFIIGRFGIIEMENQENFPVPEDFGEVSLATGMDDLNLIFLVNKDKSLISFSVVSKKYSPNNINIPENSNIIDVKTYLTYLYILDVKNDQIYRYPRAEGGFGAKVNWIKESLDLADVTGIAINENIFIARGKELIKLFRGKKQEFQIEQSVTPIKPHKVHVAKSGANIYVLDKENSRIVKFDSSGNIINQFYNLDFGSANDLSVDEDKRTLYFSTSSEIKFFHIN